MFAGRREPAARRSDLAPAPIPHYRSGMAAPPAHESLFARGEGTVRIVAPRSELPLRMRSSAPMSDEAFYEFCRANPDLAIERTAEGEIVVMSPTGARTGRRNFSLIGQLFAWTERDGSGVGFDSSTGFLLPNGAERSPDAAWVASSRWNALSAEEQEKFAPLCPDFVIELSSPRSDLVELRSKMQEYRSCGTRLGWLLELKDRRVWVYRPEGIEELSCPDELAGDPVLPGFVLDLRRVW